MISANIKAISYYLPEEILDNIKLNSKFPDWSADKISAKTGIFERRVSAENEFSGDMAVKAAEKLFLEHNIDRSEIDYLLLCTQSPDYLLPTTACIVQDKLDLPTSIGALDFNLGCSGYIYGLSLAKGLISANIATNVLLITSETYSKFIHPNDKNNLSIFGDGASATLITNQKGLCEIGDFVLGTDGSGARNLIIKNRGVKSQKMPSIDIVNEGTFISNDDFLFMNGPEIFNFTASAVPELVSKMLLKAQMEMNQIDLFIFHQANQFMLNFIRKKIQIPEDKFFLFLKECGNTVSSTIPIALREAIQSNSIKKEDKVLLAGFGVGYSWGATILKFD